MTHSPHAADTDLAIIGAGAAGLMAGIFAGREAQQAGKPLRIVALDGAKKVGAKILVSGGGRCNVTHDLVSPSDFFGSRATQVGRVLRSFDVASTIDFFERIGVTLKREATGKLFPTTDDAHTVLEALLGALAAAGAACRSACRVLHVRKIGGDGDTGFSLDTNAGPIATRRIIMATGGRSLPKTGSDGGGYDIVRALGHSVTATTPALVPLVLPDKHWLTELTGLSADVTLTLAARTGKTLHRETGAMLFTHFGLSGPAAMDISRHWIAAHAEDREAALSANLLPGRAFADAEQSLLDATKSNAKATAASVLRAWLPARLAAAVTQHGAEVDPATTMAQLSKSARRALAHALVNLPLPIVRDRGYQYAEVTAGGVTLEEVDLATMASRRCPGLSLCGEILNVDGRIGGHNFQWAWCTGRLAGMHSVRALANAE